MEKIIKQFQDLPKEVQYTIQKYTYKTQPTSLLEDIKSFVHTKTVLLELYKKTHRNYDRSCQIDWLSNDIVRFMNKDRGTINGYIDSHYEMWKRLFHLKNKSNDYIYDKTINMDFVQKSMHSFMTRIGLLGSEERKSLITYLEDLHNVV